MDTHSTSGIGRLAALAGLAFAVSSIAGNLTIGPFPDSDVALPKLLSFYADHHARVAAGGMIFAWSTILLAVFGAAVWMRIRQSDVNPVVATIALLGAAVAVVGSFSDATAYWDLGHLGNDSAIMPAALQAWHITGAEGGLTSGGGIAIFLLAAAAAGIMARAFPRWLAWSALVLGLLQLTPVAFFASILFLVWCAAAGVTMVVRPFDRERAASRSGRAAGVPVVAET